MYIYIYIYIYICAYIIFYSIHNKKWCFQSHTSYNRLFRPWWLFTKLPVTCDQYVQMINTYRIDLKILLDQLKKYMN